MLNITFIFYIRFHKEPRFGSAITLKLKEEKTPQFYSEKKQLCKNIEFAAVADIYMAKYIYIYIYMKF